MELFHNQVTLDFPSAKRFKKELGKEYDYIGISFIVPNFKKAQEMARTVRESSPKAKIILGGHGVSIPNIESMIDHDFIRKGEGVSFLRKFFKNEGPRIGIIGADGKKSSPLQFINLQLSRNIDGNRRSGYAGSTGSIPIVRKTFRLNDA